MKNEAVRKATEGEIENLAQIIKNDGCYLEVDKQDGNQWTLYREKPYWSGAPKDEDEFEAYVDSITLATSSEFDFPGISGVDCIDPVLYEAMAVVLGITLAPEE